MKNSQKRTLLREAGWVDDEAGLWLPPATNEDWQPMKLPAAWMKYKLDAIKKRHSLLVGGAR